MSKYKYTFGLFNRLIGIDNLNNINNHLKNIFEDKTGKAYYLLSDIKNTKESDLKDEINKQLKKLELNVTDIDVKIKLNDNKASIYIEGIVFSNKSTNNLFQFLIIESY